MPLRAELPRKSSAASLQDPAPSHCAAPSSPRCRSSASAPAPRPADPLPRPACAVGDCRAAPASALRRCHGRPLRPPRRHRPEAPALALPHRRRRRPLLPRSHSASAAGGPCDGRVGAARRPSRLPPPTPQEPGGHCFRVREGDEDKTKGLLGSSETNLMRYINL